MFTNYRATLHTTVVVEASWQHCWLLYSSSSNESLTFDWSMSEDGTDLLQVVFHGELRFVFFSSSGFMLNTLFLTIYAVNFEKLSNFSLMTE